MIIWLLKLAAVVLILTGYAHAQPNPCLQGFRFENVSSIAVGGPSVTGSPDAITWMQRNVGLRNDVWARNNLGGLIHYFRVAGGRWIGENLSALANGPAIRTDPVAVLGRQQFGNQLYDRHDVFAVNHHDELIHYWWSEIPPGRWHAENLTTALQGPRVWTKPIVANSSFGELSVYSLDAQGNLIHYWWTRSAGWNHENVTRMLGASRFNIHSALSLVNHHIFGSDLNAHLLHYRRDPSGWRWTNLTQVNRVQVHPSLASGTAIVERGVRTIDRLNVFGFQANQMVRYWSWDLSAPWRAENVTRDFGFLGSSGTISGTPAAATSIQTTTAGVPRPATVLVRHDVYARDHNKHLIHYWAAEPWRSFTASGGHIPWAPGENLTTKIDGVLIETDPIMVIRHSGSDLSRPEHYVFGRIGQRAVSYCWTVQHGWTSGTLQPRSIPVGENIGGDPTLSPHITAGMSLFASSTQGDLLHYWKP